MISADVFFQIVLPVVISSWWVVVLSMANVDTKPHLEGRK